MRHALGVVACCLLIGCPMGQTPPDAGGSGGDAGALDAGALDAGPSDAGGTDGGMGDAGAADSGATDSGSTDAGPALPCNQTLHQLTDIVRAGGVPNVTALGLANPNETLTLRPGDALSLPLFLFNQSTLAILGGDGGITRVSAPIYAMDHSTVQISGANVDVTQGSPFFFGDDATYDASDSGFSLGPLASNLQLEMSCGRSHAAIRDVDLTVRQPSSASVFVRDQSSFAVQGNRGLIEMTLVEGGHGDVVDTVDPQGIVGVYFQIDQPNPMTLNLFSGAAAGGPTLDIQLPTDPRGFAQSASVTNSNVFYGIWLHAGTNVTLANSSLALFLTYQGDGSASGISATPVGSPPETRLFPLADRNLTLQNTRILVLNVYEDGTSTPGTLTLDSVRIGEHTCSGVAGTRCVLTNSVVDGSGGFLSARGDAELVLNGCVLNTYIEADDQSVTRLQRGLMAGGSARPQPWIQANANAVVSLEDEFLGLPDGGGIPTFMTQANGAIATSRVFLPFTPLTVTRGTPVSVQGTAEIQTDAGAPYAFSRYALALTQGNATVPVAAGTAPVAAGALGTVDTASLDAGSYVLHLILSGDAGVISDVTRDLVIQ